MMRLSVSVVALAAIIHGVQGNGPFVQTINATQHIIGNDLWNITIGHTYGTKLLQCKKRRLRASSLVK